MSEFRGMDPDNLPKYPEAQKLTVETLNNMIKKIKEMAAQYPFDWVVQPSEFPIPPALLEVLTSDGYVKDGEWTTKGLYWLSGYWADPVDLDTGVDTLSQL